MNSESEEQAAPPAPDVILRPYRPEDEERIRDICLSTALYGQSIGPLVHNTRLVTDAFVLYHMRDEPEALYVAVANNAVVGYLAGAVSRRRLVRGYWLHILPHMAWQFFIRRHWLRRRAWRLLATGSKHAGVWRDYRDVLDRDYPALLHINLAEGYRGFGIGARLLRRFLVHLQSRGVRGVHISTATSRGMAFFSRGGFTVLATGTDSSAADGSPVKMWLMVRPVAAKPAEP